MKVRRNSVIEQVESCRRALAAAEMNARFEGYPGLRDVDFSGAFMGCPIMNDADLSGFDLRRSEFEGANLEGADLVGAFMEDPLG